MKLVLARRADADIEEIASYTAGRWGIAQAERYISDLIDHLDKAAIRGEPGRFTPDLPSSIRRLKFRSHFIFFQIDGDSMVVTRVLHEQMDAVRHLTDG